MADMGRRLALPHDCLFVGRALVCRIVSTIASVCKEFIDTVLQDAAPSEFKDRLSTLCVDGTLTQALLTSMSGRQRPRGRARDCAAQNKTQVEQLNAQAVRLSTAKTRLHKCQAMLWHCLS